VAQARRALAGDQPEAAAGNAADRPPRVERAENVPEEAGEEGEAEPDGDEEEGDREVAIRRFGAVDAGVGGDAEEEDAEGSTEHLEDRAEQHRREPGRRGAPAFVLELRRAPGGREGEEGDDEDDRGRPGEEP